MENLKSSEVTLMKSRVLIVLFSMLISALILLPLFSSAKVSDKGNNSKVYIHPMSTKGYAAVTVASVEDGKFTLTIEGDNGSSIYYDEAMKSPEDFSRVFDFSNLQEGEYTLRMQSRSENKELHFSIVNGKVKVYNNEKVTADFKIEGEKAVFSVPNASSQTFTFVIVDESGNELYSATESASEIKKVFDFSGVATGKYQILASSNGNTYTYDFEKKK